MIPTLSCPTVFAVHCQVNDLEIEVGILAVNEDFEPGQKALYDLKTGDRYLVTVPKIISPAYNVKLPYHGNSIQDSEAA